MNLYQYFLDNQGKTIHKNIHYFHAYERHFARYVSHPVLMFEIGTGGGGSAHMWKRYFGPLARIVTIDINDERKRHEDQQVKVRIGDQTDCEFLWKLVEEFGEPDIVLDDGSHQQKDIQVTFDALYYGGVAHNGVYMVEDLHTAYWPEYGGGMGADDGAAEGSFIAFAKRCVDDINAEWTRGARAPSPFGAATASIHFYDSMVVFERGQRPDTRTLITGASQIY